MRDLELMILERYAELCRMERLERKKMAQTKTKTEIADLPISALEKILCALETYAELDGLDLGEDDISE